MHTNQGTYKMKATITITIRNLKETKLIDIFILSINLSFYETIFCNVNFS